MSDCSSHIQSLTNLDKSEGYVAHLTASEGLKGCFRGPASEIWSPGDSDAALTGSRLSAKYDRIHTDTKQSTSAHQDFHKSGFIPGIV